MPATGTPSRERYVLNYPLHGGRHAFRLRRDPAYRALVSSQGLNSMANETFTAIQTTVATPGFDADNDGVIDPGEQVTTTVTITNNSDDTPTPVDATDVQFTEDLNGMTLVNQAGGPNTQRLSDRLQRPSATPPPAMCRSPPW